MSSDKMLSCMGYKKENTYQPLALNLISTLKKKKNDVEL